MRHLVEVCFAQGLNEYRQGRVEDAAVWFRAALESRRTRSEYWWVRTLLGRWKSEGRDLDIAAQRWREKVLQETRQIAP